MPGIGDMPGIISMRYVKVRSSQRSLKFDKDMNRRRRRGRRGAVDVDDGWIKVSTPRSSSYDLESPQLAHGPQSPTRWASLGLVERLPYARRAEDVSAPGGAQLGSGAQTHRACLADFPLEVVRRGWGERQGSG